MSDNKDSNRGSIGEPRPDGKSVEPQTEGSLPQEKPEDRHNVSIVKPEDYPAEDRLLAAEIAGPSK